MQNSLLGSAFPFIDVCKYMYFYMGGRFTSRRGGKSASMDQTGLIERKISDEKRICNFKMI
jgi:hypothetical protein